MVGQRFLKERIQHIFSFLSVTARLQKESAENMIKNYVNS